MTDPHPTINHQWCDAWLLVAVTLAAGKAPASLKEIVAAADAVQHAIPEFPEVDGGLARLFAADLLERGPRGFALTARGVPTNIGVPLSLAAPPAPRSAHRHRRAV
jgi:hypothetical protein